MQTIFLATDGRHVILGRDLAEMSDATLAGIRAQGLRGWVATLANRRAAKPVRVSAVEGADLAQWDAAVAAFLAARA